MQKYNDNNSVTFRSVSDLLIEGLLMLLLLFLPLALGARTPWSEELFILLSGLIVFIFLLRNLFCPRAGFHCGWSFILLVLFLALVSFQLISLPTEFVKIISPNTYAMKTQLLSDLFVDGKAPARMTLSFYTWATRHDFRLLISLAGLFLVVSNVYSDPARVKRLLRWIAYTGGLVALIAVIQKLFGNGKVYGFVEMVNQGFVGPFANHSHYAQYMNMTIGAAIGLVCMDLYEKFSGVKRTPNEILKYLFSGNSKRLWLLFGIMAVSSATVFVSLSRGGMIGMLTAFSIIALLMFRRGRLNMDSFSIALTGLAAFSIVLFLGFEAVYDRFGSIFDISQYHWRAQILKDMAGSFKQFPLWGTGQGTHSVIYPLFQRIATALEFTHAENEYAQVLEETGILGLGVLIAFAAVILKKVVGLFRARNNSACVAAYGMAFGLIAILIHSLSDFGQHVPANAVLSIVFAAIIVALARKVKETEPKPARLKIIGVASFRTVVLATAVGIFALLLISADKARVSDKYWKQVLAIEDTLTKDRWKANERAYEDIIRLATVSRDGQKDNARYRHWYNVYRLQELKSRCDLNEYGLSEAVQSTVNSIVDDLNGARLDCPTYAPLYCLIGRIEIFYLNKDSGLEKIKKAYELHRNDPVICFNRGLVDLIESNQEASIDKFKRAMKLNPGLVHEVANELICDFSLPLLAVDSTDNDPKLLSVTIKKLKEMEYYDIADSARAKMQQLLEAKCSLSKVAPGMRIMLGDIYREKEMTSKAIECYELALDADFAQVQWRYTLAELLIEQGRYPEAMAKAKMCLKFQPQFQPARQLVMDLAMMKETFQPDGTVKW